ncbi:MAG: hypothetical protein WC748_04425 [Legionellales bacterium]|jgi:hypothetical protein
MPVDAAILEKLRKNDPSLTYLHLHGLIDDDVFTLCAALETNTNLTTLHIEGYRVRNVDKLHLLPLLERHTRGQDKYFFNRSHIGDEGAKALARINSLERLFLTNNQIGDDGAKALARHPHLTFLSIGQNTIQDLDDVSSLVQVGDDGATALARNTNLIYLSLRNSKISAVVDEEFARNTNLIFLDIAPVLNITPKKNQSDNWKLARERIEQNQQLSKQLLSACQAQNLTVARGLLRQGVRPYGAHCKVIYMNFKRDQLPHEDTVFHLAVRQRNMPLLNLLLSYNVGSACLERNADKLTYIELAESLNFSITPTSRFFSYMTNIFNFDTQSHAPASNTNQLPVAISNTSNSNSSTQIVSTNIPTISAAATAQLTAAGMDIPDTLTVISTLQTKHTVLLKALSDWESRAQQDATEKSELEEISKELEVKAYYQMLKAILAQSFLAATVIASGKIDGNTGVGIKAINGLSTLSAAASSASAAVFPLAAPILGFFKVVSNALNSTLTYREMQKHVKWVDLEDIPQFAETLARGSARAQKRSIPLGISRADETTWTKIKNECGLFIEQLKSGVTFSSGEKRALLDAQLLFEYILTHERPLDIALSGRINILLQHLVGPQATLTSSVSSSNNNSPIVAVTQNNSFDITHLLKAEVAALKEKHELDQQEQARRLQELHDKIRILQEQQTPKVESNHVDVGNGQMQLTLQTQSSAHALSSASRATLTDVYKRLDEHDKAVAELGQQVAMTQEELTALGKSTSGKTATNSDDEDDNEAGIGNCFTM